MNAGNFAEVVSFESFVFETDLKLIFLIEFFSCGSQLPTFRSADKRAEHQLQDSALSGSPNAFGMILRRRFGSGN